MWKRDISHWIVILLSALVVAFCVYVIHLGMIAGDHNRMWIFTLFGVLFSVPLLVSIFHVISEKSIRFHKIYNVPAETGKTRKTPFVPHWFVVAGIFFIGFSIIFAIIKGILSSLAK